MVDHFIFMTENQITKKQHFVPVFYMKKFASQDNFLKVLDLKQGKLLKQKPYSGVCYDKYYYAQKTGEQDEVSQIVEECFSSLETTIANQYQKIYDKIVSYQHLNDEERYVLSVFASMLWLRGEYMRKQINRMNEDIMKQTMSLRASHPSFPDYIKKLFKEKDEKIADEEVENMRKMLLDKSYKLKFNNAEHLEFLSTYENFANMFYGKNWRIYLAQGQKKFITSDNPVIEWFPERKHFAYGASFLERKHYLVLSQEVLIEMVNPISGKNLKRKVISDDEVLEYNRLRAEYSIKYCYGFREDELNDLILYKQNRIDTNLKYLIRKNK